MKKEFECRFKVGQLVTTRYNGVWFLLTEIVYQEASGGYYQLYYLGRRVENGKPGIVIEKVFDPEIIGVVEIIEESCANA